MTFGKAKCHFGCIDADDLADAVMAKLLPPWPADNRDDLRAEILRQDKKQAGDGDRAKAEALGKKVERLEREIVRATAELVETDSESQIKRLRAAIKAKEKEQEAAQGALRELQGRNALSDPEKGVDEALALLDALQKARESGDRKAQKGVLHEAVTKIEVFFNRQQRGERTRSTFAQALVWLPPDLWAVLTSGVGGASRETGRDRPQRNCLCGVRKGLKARMSEMREATPHNGHRNIKTVELNRSAVGSFLVSSW
jgi:hypothetical protein